MAIGLYNHETMKPIQFIFAALIAVTACKSTQPTIHLVTYDGRKSFEVSGPQVHDEIPVLSVPGARQGDIIRVHCDFYARSNGTSRSKGFYYHLKPLNGASVNAISPNDALFQASTGWQSCNMVVYFEVTGAIANDEPVSFAFELDKRDISGNGQLGMFSMTGEVLPKGTVILQSGD